MTADFMNKLDDALDMDPRPPDPYGARLTKLREIAEAIERKMNRDLDEKRVFIDVVPGFQAYLGQQFKVLLRIPSKNFQDSLFRAYIPTNGDPVNLDLYGEDPIACNSDEELEDNILDFMAKIRDRMAQYREYAVT